MADGSSCEFLLAPAGDTGGLATEFREFSKLNFTMASFMRFDMGSVILVSEEIILLKRCYR